MNGAAEITIVIPARDEADRLTDCILAIKKQPPTFKSKLLVIDSGSGLLDEKDSPLAGAAIIKIPPEDFSHSRTRQFAAESCSTELVVFTVADAVPADENWLAELVKPLEDPAVAGSFGLQLAPPGTRGEPLAMSVSKGQEKLQDRIVRFEGPAEWDALSPMAKREAANFDNCTSCIRRELLVGAYPFPDVGYGEDMFWAASVLKAGYGIARASRARVYHMHNETFGYLFRRMIIDARLCSEHFGYRPIPNLILFKLRWLHTVYKIVKIDLLKGMGIPLYRPDRRIYWAFRDLWRQTGSLLGKYLGSLPAPEQVPSWRPLRKRLARYAEGIATSSKPLHRKDFS